jgi:hypothetical protein
MRVNLSAGQMAVCSQLLSLEKLMRQGAWCCLRTRLRGRRDTVVEDDIVEEAVPMHAAVVVQEA